MTSPVSRPVKPETSLPASALDEIFAPVAHIDAYLTRWLGAVNLPTNLREAMIYAVVGGGKRLRPVLAWHCCAAFGAPGAASLPAGASLELVHAFSLVHDDLPALDNDDLRRGRPTLHKHAGEAMAILAGDALLACAGQLLLEESPQPVRAQLTLELLRATNAMIGGQVLDTLGGFEADQSPLERVQLVHHGKTAALIRAACVMGALSARGRADTPPISPSQLEQIDQFGAGLGLMFQIVDDLIDVEQSTEHTGKKTQKDADAGKLTYPGVLGTAGSRAEVSRLKAEALAICGQFDPENGGARSLRALVEYLSTRTK
jgi:geranylgeranyl diphosphate synthase, type II